MRTHALAVCLCLTALPPLALAQDESPDRPASTEPDASKPINAMCPIGREPIMPSAGTVEYKGRTIGLCCPGCGERFLAWEEARKDEFVTLALTGREPGPDAPPAPDEAAAPPAWSDPYPFPTCPVSSLELGSMGDPIVRRYEGREVRFCCEGCIEDFEADLAASWKKIDESIVRDQLRYYPIDTCVVSGEPLVEGGEDIATNIVYGNRLVRLCCKMCEREFAADPGKFIAKLDGATADAQRKDYPLETCIVAGGELGAMGEPVEMVVAGRLMRFCCADCKEKVMADPARYIAGIDKAWQAAGRYMPHPQEPGEEAHDAAGAGRAHEDHAGHAHDGGSGG